MQTGTAGQQASATGSFTSSLTDLMTSLAIIFILLFVLILKQASDQAKKSKDLVRAELDALLAQESLALKQDPDDPLTLRVMVGEKQLKFPVGSSNLGSSGSKFVNGLFTKFAAIVCRPELREKIDSVVVEGYTDRSGEQSAGGIQRNIQLSQARSYAVLKEGLNAVDGDEGLHRCLLDLASASGRGSRNPVYTEGVYDPDKSRRVELKIRVRSQEQQMKSVVSGD